MAMEELLAMPKAGCEESGEPTGLERLLALPTATLSIEAQKRLSIESGSVAINIWRSA